jgi:hypothetical protein
MRKIAVMFLVALFVIGALVVRVFGAAQTVTGQLIDLACYWQDKSTVNPHHGWALDCAQACAREGFAVGVLTPDGKVYQVTGDLAARNNAKLLPHMTQTVTITGDISEKSGQLMIAGTAIK